MPKSLFRYRSVSEFSMSALLEDKIYFSKPIDFNDPYDCLYHVSATFVDDLIAQEFSNEKILENIEKVRSGEITLQDMKTTNFEKVVEIGHKAIMEASQENINWLRESLLEMSMEEQIRPYIEQYAKESHAFHQKDHREEIGVVCFSEEITSVLMWSHYSDYHKGFCLEYDTDDMSELKLQCYKCQNKCNKQHVLELYPIIYSKMRYDATNYEYEMLKHRLQFAIGHNEPIIVPDMLHYVKTNTAKSQDWAYEKEWRYILTCRPNTEKIITKTLKPKAIYLGSKMSKENKGILLQLVKDRDIKVYEMFMDESGLDFKLDYREIPNN